MKILCATDFSEVSYNAIRYAYEFAKQYPGAKIEVTHCIDTKHRSDIFTKLDDILMDQAKEDMRILKSVLKPSEHDIQVDTSVFVAQPKSFVPRHAKNIGADLIVIGTTGLTAMKDILLGSVTAYIARHTDIPLLAVPGTCQHKLLTRVIIGMGREFITHPERMSFISTFFGYAKPRVYLTQVVKGEKYSSAFESEFAENFPDYPLEVIYLEMSKSISHTLNLYVKEISADLICLIHQPRGWLGRLIQPSVMKDELYGLEKPLLIIPDLEAPMAKPVLINDEDEDED